MASPTVHALGPDSLAERLAEEMRRRWRDGERSHAEAFLDSHPELWDHPHAAAELIYEEICLREEDGQPGAASAVLRRFPQWAAQLRVMIECHRALDGDALLPFPSVGESLGDCTLVAEFGRGSQGRVFLATQPALADRPVVLKLIPLASAEHVSLARLQHTHIVPLYSVQDFPERRLRALCMPYFGGATLATLLTRLRDLPPAQRTASDLRRALEQAQSAIPLTVQVHGATQSAAAAGDYVQAICRLGASLAEALAYAHARGLLHLDLKPSNILLATDGEPMLLDFHLARGPVAAGSPAPAWLGGTPPYLAPEQRAAMEAVRSRAPLPEALDGRADVYALGMVLYEALAGKLPGPGEADKLRALNPSVSAGLADLIARCVAVRPQDRYPDAAALAEDLRRHLADEPLRGVRNRDLGERWRKWHRRRPHALRWAALVLVLAAGLMAAALHIVQQLRKAGAALDEGRMAQHQGRLAEARSAFRHGLVLAEGLPFSAELVRELNAGMRQAERAELANQLQATVEQLRGLFGTEQLPPKKAQILERLCRALWEDHSRIRDRLGSQLSPERERQTRADLLDLAVLWSDLRVRLAGRGDEARREALRVLTEAEEAFGPSAVLCHERARHARALGLEAEARAAEARGARTAPQSAWEHCALGLSYLRSGDTKRAMQELEQAVELEPQGLWPNFARGRCAYLLERHEDALVSFTACVALAPHSAVCWYNRGLAYEALGRTGPALHDYERALRLNPALAPAVQGRQRVRGGA